MTEAFKLQVVREYEEGASLSSLRRKYGIGGTMTIPLSSENDAETEIRKLRRRIA